MANESENRITVDLSGQVAVVTGAARGIGRTIAETLARAGARVACVDINPETLAAAVEAIRAAGGAADAFPGDVTQSAQVNELINRVLETMGRLDILVNNAGITRDGAMVRMEDEQWDAVININLRGTFLCTRAVARPMMKARRRRIINIASVSGLMGNKGQANYSASKAGVMGLTRTVALELASRNITVNAVAPGFIATEMALALGEVVLAEVKRRTPLGRLGAPQDVADAVLFLASDAASFITGVVLRVDGGLTV